MRMKISSAVVTAPVACVALLVAACNNAKSPDSVAADVVNARQKAVSAVAEVQNDTLREDAKVEAALDDKNAEDKSAANSQTR